MQIVMAAPLYLLAEAIPGIGLVHTVYLLNIFVCAATGVLIFLYALTLDYDMRVGSLGAVLFGLGSIAWPYSKTFFREPLVMLFLLAVALCLEKWRRSRYRQLHWFLLALLAGVAATTSKITAVVGVPALMIVVVPALSARLRRPVLILVASIGAIVLALVASFIPQLGLPVRTLREWN